MANDLFLVFATPKDTIDEAEFNAFQDRHNVEVLRTPGFVAARRYALRKIRGEEIPAPFHYMTMYEVTLPPAQLREELARTAADRERPEWYPREVSVQAFDASTLDGHPDPSTTEHAFLTFTGTPREMNFDQYNAWYSTHIEENIEASPAIERGFRFQLAARGADDVLTPDHLAIYALTGPPEQMLEEVRASHAAAGRSNPDGFHAFASFEATALADQKRAS